MNTIKIEAFESLCKHWESEAEQYVAQAAIITGSLAADVSPKTKLA